jgi:hypothetical protein
MAAVWGFGDVDMVGLAVMWAGERQANHYIGRACRCILARCSLQRPCNGSSLSNAIVSGFEPTPRVGKI